MIKYITILFLIVANLEAATFTAPTGNLVDVQATYDNNGTNGDTWIIPDGHWTWTNHLNVIATKTGIVRGSSSNSVEVIDATPTSIRSADASLFKIAHTNLTTQFELSDMTLSFGGPTAYATFGVIRMNATDNLTGTNSAWRIHHICFNNVRGRPVNIYAWSGLIDHCTGVLPNISGFSIDGRVSSSNKGHLSWATPIYYSTVNEGIYFENNTFHNTGAAIHAISDGFAGARFVWRNNTLINLAVEGHGTESTQTPRGTRYMTSYGNTMIVSNSVGGSAHFFRSGTGVIMSNNVTGFAGLATFVNYRDNGSWPPYRQCNGTNIMDFNDITGGPLGDGIYFHGTHNGGTTNRLIDTTANFNIDLTGYSVINLNRGVGAITAGVILSNTLTTIYYFSDSTYQLYWTNGELYQVCKVIYGLDQPGMGQGDLLTGGSSSPVVLPTPPGWPNENIEPIVFIFNTGVTNVSGDSRSGGAHIVRNIHYLTRTNFPPAFALLPDPHPYESGVPIINPTISSMTNIYVAVNGTTPSLPFTIGAGRTNVNAYTLHGMADNPTLMPQSGFTYGGSGANRTLQLTPAAGQFGTTTIALTVSDEQPLTATTYFDLNIVGNVPTISTIPNQAIATNSDTGLLSFIISDAVVNATNLVVTCDSSDTNCIPLNHIQLSGTSSNRFIKIFSTNLFGLSRIDLSVSNGTTNATTLFYVDVPSPSTARPVSATNVRVNNATIGR